MTGDTWRVGCGARGGASCCGCCEWAACCCTCCCSGGKCASASCWVEGSRAVRCEGNCACGSCWGCVGVCDGCGTCGSAVVSYRAGSAVHCCCCGVRWSWCYCKQESP